MCTQKENSNHHTRLPHCCYKTASSTINAVIIVIAANFHSKLAQCSFYSVAEANCIVYISNPLLSFGIACTYASSAVIVGAA